ncbi:MULTISPECIES: alpha/beta fold hydrolase [unclassified Streptomyces]|uniref:alpha/beta fold hydrolase n=1 Tax=unclassified Streptomyces TaxID=2593676 RepID=UPI0010D37A0E|nr:alpha/beta hydrolase [Streptomyces sp. BK208]TDT22730.1 pimeloyl-ACP methyl ester carboxylesterase [Streptomyces sp. BK208]
MELTVPVSGGAVWAEDTGGDGPPVVLLHPGVGDSRVWDPVLPQLVEHHRVIRYDVRGYGRSPQPTASYSLLDDLVAVLDYFRLRRVSLVGCSMGGGTAMSLALAYPDRVTALVLLCPGITGYPWPEEPKFDAEYDALIEAGDVEGLVTLGLREWAAAGADEAAVAQLRAAAPAWLTEDEYQRVDPPVFDRLGELSTPAVVMVGDLDRPTLIACNEEVAARIPSCRLMRMPGVDHLPPLRVPDLVADTIRTYSRSDML